MLFSLNPADAAKKKGISLDKNIANMARGGAKSGTPLGLDDVLSVS